MGRISELSGETYHQRDLSFTITDVDDNHFVAAGELCDRRPKTTYRFTGKARPTGVMHNMELFLLIRKDGLIIEDLEVIIHSVPLADCHKVNASLEPIKGLAIKGGFSKEVRSRVGSTNGCTHLNHLLSVMAPAIMQGYWAIRDKQPRSGPEENSKQVAKTATYIKNSCFAWRAEGDAYHELLSYHPKTPPDIDIPA